MVIKSATFDPSRRLDLYFRINRAGSKRFVFVDSDGADYDISGIDFELFISDYPGARVKRLSLTIGDGLVLLPYESNLFDAEVTADETIANEGEYYWELYLRNEEKTWLSGKAFFHNGEFDGVNSDTETFTISTTGETIQITVNG